MSAISHASLEDLAMLPERRESGELERAVDLDDARAYAANALAENTRRAYRAAWNDFAGWCADHDVTPIPADPETVVRFLVTRARTLKVSTISLRLVVIREAHRTAGEPDPTAHAAVTETWQGIRRTHGTEPEQKDPALVRHLRVMVDTWPDTLAGVRNRAVLLVGFGGAFRRSGLVAFDWEDVEWRDAGIVLHQRRSKSDQEGRGRKIAIPRGANPKTCPVSALAAWGVRLASEDADEDMDLPPNVAENADERISPGQMPSGPLFRSIDRWGNLRGVRRLPASSVADIVKEAAEAAGLDPERYGAHSLRAGFATEAFERGLGELQIAEQTGHRSLEVLRGYIRRGDESLFRRNAAGEVGL